MRKDHVMLCGLQVRSIQYNLKDAKNPDLRRRVLTGDIDPQVI